MPPFKLVQKTEDPPVDVRQGKRFCSTSKRADQLWGQIVSYFKGTGGSQRGIKSAGA